MYKNQTIEDECSILSKESPCAHNEFAASELSRSAWNITAVQHHG